MRRNKSYFAFQHPFIEGRNRQFEANFLPYLFKKEWLRDWALNACDVNPVSCSQSVIAEITGWRHRLLRPVSHKARLLLREPGSWSLVKNRDWAQVPFYCLFLHVICFYFLKRKILAMGYSTLNAAFDWKQNYQLTPPSNKRRSWSKECGVFWRIMRKSRYNLVIHTIQTIVILSQ